ncbi:hypothetical protein AVEN_31589-1 [Araneus ventricosus]|uniref:DDE-1 domain-containing protein n=1 Tax=Araneus ventricosus TaxID=182803 RepID=A0A4Y2T308_ARAVE|nr:hypothetical protein AVEN_31589-1 [Araneus ventricosus]
MPRQIICGPRKIASGIYDDPRLTGVRPVIGHGPKSPITIAILAREARTRLLIGQLLIRELALPSGATKHNLSRNKYRFKIIACHKKIDNAWEEFNNRALTSAWKKLWPDRIVECDFEEFETKPTEPVVNEIVSLAKIMGLELDNNDIDKLVEEHSSELTTEEFTELLSIPQQQDIWGTDGQRKRM